MPRFEKGSNEAKEHMRKVREGRKKKESTQNQTESMINNVEPVEIETVKKRGKLIKNSIESIQEKSQKNGEFTMIIDIEIINKNKIVECLHFV